VFKAIKVLGVTAAVGASLALAGPAMASPQAESGHTVSVDANGIGGPFPDFDSCEIDREFVIAHGTYANGCFMEDNGLWWYQWHY
jgi:hypothetical protein